MDLAELITRRKGKYMAQTLEAFEQLIEPLLPASGHKAIEDYKGLVRARFNALATDSIEAAELVDTHVNGAAQDLKDRLSAVGRP